jgi:hypothetical protein
MDVIKVDPFTNVGVSSKATATFRPPAPLSLFGLVLVCGGTTLDESNVSSLKVKAGGKELIPGLTGARHRDAYEYDGVVYDDAHIPLLFGDPTARTMRGKHLGNFDFSIYPQNMTIEVDIDGDAEAPTLEAYALVMPPKQLMGVGFSAAEAAIHRALVETVLQASAAVTEKAYDIGLGSEAGALLKKLYFFHEGDMTTLTVKKQGLDIFEQVPEALNEYLQDDLFTRLPQANLYVWDTIVDGDYSEVKTTVRQDGSPANYQIRVSTSAAETITVYADVLTRLPLL